MFDTLRADLRFALRSLRTSPIYSVSSIATLAIGIAASTTIFCVVQTVMLQALPYRAPERLVTLWESSPVRRLPKTPVTPPHLQDWREQSQTFAGFAASQSRRFVVSPPGEEPERIAGVRVSSNYFGLLGVPIARGRALVPADSQTPTVAVLSHGLWIRRFGADSGIVGRRIELDGTPFTVVGVAAPSWNLLAQLWIPLSIPPDLLADRQAHMLTVIGRLRSGATVDAARADMNRIAQRSAAAYPEADKDWSILAIPILEQTVGNVRPALITLAVGVVLLLVIACVNVSGLALTRGRARSREIAIRAALGASRRRVARQLTTESMVLLLLALATSAALAWIAIGFVRRNAPASIPRIADLHVGLPALVFAMAVAAASVLIAVVLPAIQASRADLVGDLRDRSGSGARHRSREVILVTQIGFAIVLLSVSAVLIKRFVALRAFDLGVRDTGVLVAQVSLPRSRYREPQRQASFVENVVQRAAGLPGVQSAVATTNVPGSPSTPIYLFEIRGRTETDPTAQPASYFVSVTSGYFGALSIPVLRGRDFTSADRDNSAPVVVVDQSLARRYFPGGNALGEHVFVAGDSVPREIVGIVGSVKQGGVSSEDYPVLYAPLLQMPSPEVTVALRVAGSTSAAVPGLRSAIREIDPQAPVLDVAAYRDRIASFIAPDSFYAAIALIFSVIALLLCGIGLYGVVAFDVARQRRDIGVRMALGASTKRIRRDVTVAAMRLVVTGVVLGAVVAVATQSAIRRLFVDVSSDVVGLSIACAALLGAGLCAAFLPALRASRVDPLAAIRSE
jgi:putative ABC transport system permease protein